MPFCRRYRRLKAQNVLKPLREHRLEVQNAVFPPSHRVCAFAADFFLGGGAPLILHYFFILFFASFWEGFSNHSAHSLGHHFQQQSEKRRLQCSMKRAYENSPGKNWGLGALQTSKTRSACRREHDSVVLSHSRQGFILD